MVRRNDSQSKKDEEVKTMDKMFELINSLNALTKAVTALTEKITSEYLNTFETIYDSEKDEPQETTAKEQPTPEQQTVTFVELRSRLSEISRNGHTAEVRNCSGNSGQTSSPMWQSRTTQHCLQKRR